MAIKYDPEKVKNRILKYELSQFISWKCLEQRECTDDKTVTNIEHVDIDSSMTYWYKVYLILIDL